MRGSVLLAVASIAAVAGTAAARPSLTTLFNQNNGGSAGGGVYFQIVVGPNPIQVTGFDTNTSAIAGTAVPFRVYTATGTHSGNEPNPLAWTLQASGSGTAAGINLPTAITLGNSFVLNANTSYGIALTLSSATGTPAPAAHSYSGTGTSPLPGAIQYSNSDITLNLGTATNVLFSGTPFNPRIWNGTIHYNVIPAPASLALLGLGGLIAARRRR